MGGKLTVMIAAADHRIMAAAPSCGGLSDRPDDNAIYRATINDEVNLRHIVCPIIFLSPSNDFHGRINHLQNAVREIASPEWRVTCSPHHSHQDTAEYEVATQLWFDQVLKGTFKYPATPRSSLDLKTASGVPVFMVTPDAAKPILYVDIFYTQQGQEAGEITNRENRINRFWHHAAAAKTGGSWTAELPLFSTDLPLWVYANVGYPLEQPVTGAGYYYSSYTAHTFNLSSLMAVAAPEQLKAVGIAATLKPALLIESFAGDWEKEWFTYKPEDWARRTHKLYDGQWQAPPGAKLALEVRAAQPNKFVVGLDDFAAEVQLAGGSQWQPIVLSASDFRNAAGETTLSWAGVKELRLGAAETLSDRNNAVSIQLGAKWLGPRPEFRDLRWISE